MRKVALLALRAPPVNEIELARLRPQVTAVDVPLFRGHWGHLHSGDKRVREVAAVALRALPRVVEEGAHLRPVHELSGDPAVDVPELLGGDPLEFFPLGAYEGVFLLLQLRERRARRWGRGEDGRANRADGDGVGHVEEWRVVVTRNEEVGAYGADVVVIAE